MVVFVNAFGPEIEKGSHLSAFVVTANEMYGLWEVDLGLGLGFRFGWDLERVAEIQGIFALEKKFGLPLTHIS